MVEDVGYQASRPRPSTAVPGPTGLRKLRWLYRVLTCGNRPSEGLDPHFFATVREEYGPIARIPIPARPDIYVLSKPEYVEQVLERNQHNYRKYEPQVNDLTQIFGRGLVTADGDYWKRHKRMLSPMLTQRRVTTFDDVVSHWAETAFERWADHDGPIDLADESFNLIFQILSSVLFGGRFEQHQDDLLTGLFLIQDSFPRKASPIPTLPWVPTPHDRRLARASSKLDTAIERMMMERCEESGERSDFLGWLVANDDTTVAEVHDELKTLLIAGLVVATALTWTLHSLSQHPEIKASLRSKLQNEERVEHEPSVDSESDRTLLKRVIRESLRLYPPLPPSIRRPISEDTIGGYVVPPGTRIVVNQVQIHRDPNLWDDPLTFRPERFENGWREERPKYSYYPFGGGARMCIGRQFAYMMLQRLVSHCVSNYEVDAVVTESFMEMNPITPSGIQIKLTHRSRS